MIPLGHWLLRAPETPEQEGVASSYPPSPEQESLVSTDYVLTDAMERVRELEDALAAANRLNEAEKTRAAAREDEISHQLGVAMADSINTALTLGLAELQRTIETAVRDVLVPFLGLSASKKAATELIGLIQEEVAHNSETVLEVRAPQHLHQFLEPVFGSSETAIVLDSASSVEVVCPNHRARFETLAERWVDAVRELQDG